MSIFRVDIRTTSGTIPYRMRGDSQADAIKKSLERLIEQDVGGQHVNDIVIITVNSR